jgi:hypothetical protein
MTLPDPNGGAEPEAASKPSLEVQIHTVAKSEHTPREKAEELFSMFTKLDWQGQRKVALAAVSQVSDADYKLIRERLLNPKLDRRVLSVFLTDTLKRKNSIKMPALLELARTDGHPLQEEARGLLCVFIQKNYGADWAKWEKAVDAWLANNPT